MEKLDFPNRITIELTNNCNVSCVFCNRNKVPMQIGYMSDELFKKIVDEASTRLPVKVVPFFRGESLMHPHFVDLIRYAKKKGLGPIQFASNALLLDEEMQDKIIEAGIDYISFSLDTLDENVYKKTRLSGNLKISSKNVENFGVKCREAKEKGLQTPTLQVSTINIPEYKNMQSDFISKWLEYVDVVRVYEQHDENGRIVNSEVRERLELDASRKPCRKVFSDMIVYWDGKLAMCNYDWASDKDLGDLNTMTIEEAWNSVNYEKLRYEHNNDCIQGGICKECHHWMIDYTREGYIGRSYTR